ncbi:hypothetical protein TKK_0014130 [Trichogramma kaykai]|uniref:Serine-rich adhesin for platelets n=1 Tax=Trichogramma kaykai TaxID=54128 RepID=A0ABD2WEE5_9HYME
MSTAQCKHFVQNAWKKELCSNCFKSREEHAAKQETIRPLMSRTTNNVKRVAHKVQGILRLKSSSSSPEAKKRKNVAFPESLTEIIGYDGGDDFDLVDDGDSNDHSVYGDDPDSSSDPDELPDSEEERALGNLTRANTNFNTVTANLSASIEQAKAQTKAFTTLMLGRAQKDNEGKKTTLLVSVKPFGGDDSMPTAKRPADKKTSPDLNKPKVSTTTTPPAVTTTAPTTIKSVQQTKSIETFKSEIKPIKKSPAESSNKSSVSETKPSPLLKATLTTPSLGKIVDMPLITSTVLPTNILDSQKKQQLEQKRTTNIARTPAIKKTDNEKPRLVATSADQNTAKNQKNLEITNGNGVELKLNSTTTTTVTKEIYKSTFRQIDLTERKVEGEAATDANKLPEKQQQSRESAGEPDGKADEEIVADPPALPKSPPPPMDASYKRLSSEPRASFLHGMTTTTVESVKTSKPMVPQKPSLLPSVKPVGSSLASLLIESRAYEFRLSQKAQSESQLCGGESMASTRTSVVEKFSERSHQQQVDEEAEVEDDDSEASSSSDQPSRLVSKRRQAPQPPTTTSPTHAAAGVQEAAEATAPSLFARNPVASKSDSCPVVREKEKRERASSCSPKFRKAVNDSPDPTSCRPPEPVPRRVISLSQDSLAPATVCSGSERIAEEKKKTRSKFSLKKFLRMGSKKDVDMTSAGSSSLRSDEIPCTPQPKPRLEIIHPLELDGAAVQVVLRGDKSIKDKSVEPAKSATDSALNNGYSQANPSSPHQVTARPSKPPPPPRAQSLDESSRSPTTPKQQPIQQQQVQQSTKSLVGKSWQPNAAASSSSSASDSIYANLDEPTKAPTTSTRAATTEPGGVAGLSRSALAPAKPRRTSSLRDQASIKSNDSLDSAKDAASRTFKPSQSVDGDGTASVTDSQILTSGSECDDTSLELRQAANHPVRKRQSDSGVLDSNNKELKFQQSLFSRSTSLPYCAGTETNYYHRNGESDDLADPLMGRLRQRRSRSIVHHSLEDNYGAVVVANHEALAQILEQTNKTPSLPLSLRGLKTANLRFQDFKYNLTSAIATGRRVFVPSASWSEQQISFCVTFESVLPLASRKEFYLTPVVEFVDTVGKDIIELAKVSGRKISQATISVLPRLQVHTLKTFADSLQVDSDEAATRELAFVLLQLVSAFKSLQAQGIEEAPKSLDNVVLCREEKDIHYRLYLFQGLNIENNENDGCTSLCRCALIALDVLNLTRKLPLVQELLTRERAVTLSQVKSILEFSLWGPADATLGGPRERETALQRWLDLERATVLQALVMRARSQLSLLDEYQLLFLVRTSAKIMCEASLLLDRQKSGLFRGKDFNVESQ